MICRSLPEAASTSVEQNDLMKTLKPKMRQKKEAILKGRHIIKHVRYILSACCVSYLKVKVMSTPLSMTCGSKMLAAAIYTKCK